VKTDALIEADVISELKWEPIVDATKISVSVKGGIVTLRGYVNNYSEKIGAERAAERVSGVKAIVQEIKVNLPSSFGRSDAAITRAATDALEWNMTIPDNCITVKVRDGWVTLTGEVDWLYQRKSAEDTASCLRGVIGVANQIAVKPLVSPINVKQKIESAFQRHSVLDAKRLSVEAVGSKVILTGIVHSWIEKQEAGAAAWAAPGVSDVENNIIINP
jgi:osmotically-inducible protein OsmY